MKKLFGLILLLGVSTGWLCATDYPLNSAFSTVSGTVFTATGTNAVGSALGTAFDIEKSVYHTFHFVTTCTNSSSLTLYRSLDGVGWVPFNTNTVTATATNGTTMTGKWKYVAGHFSGTNASVTVLYLGQ